jgi:hypothetical protein
VQGLACYDGDSEDLEDEEDTVTLPKEQYDLMVEDLLTMGRADRHGIGYAYPRCDRNPRTRQVHSRLCQLEKERLSLYRAAAKEARKSWIAGRICWMKTMSRTSISPTESSLCLTEKR